MFIRRVKRHEQIPPFYGPYRRDFLTDESFCLPIPLCFVVGLLGAGLSTLRWCYIAVLSSPHDAYEQGVRAGLARRALSEPPQNVTEAPAMFQHKWDRDGERCLNCGNKDWMACPCSGPAKSGDVGP